MKRAVWITMMMVFAMLSGCDGERGETLSEEENPCTDGYNETLDMCAWNVFSDTRFGDVEISLDDNYNLGSATMIGDVLYNYFTSTLEFSVYHEADLDVRRFYVSVVDLEESLEIINESLPYEYERIDRNQVHVSLQEDIYLEGLEPGGSYLVKIEYDYQVSDQFTRSGAITSFLVDASMYENVDAPTLHHFEVLSRTLDSLELAISVQDQGTSVDRLELRVFDSFTGAYTGISKAIENLDPYRDDTGITIPSIVISGLKSNVGYDIRIYGSGSNTTDTYEDVALFDTQQLKNQFTDKHFYERVSFHFFHFDITSLVQEDNGISLVYGFEDARDDHSAFQHHNTPVHLQVKNAMGTIVYEVELDTTATEHRIPQSVFDQADVITVYYQNHHTNQTILLATWGKESIPIQD